MDSQNNRRKIWRILKALIIKIIDGYAKAVHKEYPIYDDDGNVLGVEIFTAHGGKSVRWMKDNEVQKSNENNST